MAQAEAAAVGTTKTPILILHARGQAIGQSFAVVRLAEWVALHGPVSVEQEKQERECYLASRRASPCLGKGSDLDVYYPSE